MTEAPPTTTSGRTPELLAPAGDWEAMRAAVANGADAVYFGLSNFNARHRATNFQLEELPEVMQYLHSHNVRGYVTFNTLIFSDELPEALRFVRGVAQAGADAVIVQDLGLAKLISRMCPNLHVHGSTQMTLTEPLGIEFVKRLGVRRVILARELSVGEVGRIAQKTDVPVEVFVHGALCVSYSGQCLTSESLGRRSANRGQCAQACRLPYELIVDGTPRDLGEKAYLLSPQDLAAYDLIDDLASVGVCSFKIEGRLKSAHYVAATTQTYRAAIDAAANNRDFRISREQSLDLAQSFSRGFSHGFLDGVNHQELVHARFPKSRGVRVGTVVGATRSSVIVEMTLWHSHPGCVPAAGGKFRPGGRTQPRAAVSQSSLPEGEGAKGRFVASGEVHAGDGVVFDEGHPEQDEQGGRVATVVPRGHGRFEITFERGALNPAAVAIGATAWKTDDPAVRRRLEESFRRDRVAHRVPLTAEVSAQVGQQLRIVVRDDSGHEARIEWDQALAAAQKHPLTEQLFREQFGRLGDSPFEPGEVRGLETASPAIVPKSVLNDLRRRAVQRLIELRENPARRMIAEPDALENLRSEISYRFAPAAEPETELPHLHVLVRSLEQLDAVLKWNPPDGIVKAGVYCELEDLRRYKDAIAKARETGVPIGLATVRIIKPSEEGLLKQIADREPDCVLIRNLAGLSWFSNYAPQLPLIADYALNVANEITAALLAEHGVRRLVPSYDLSWTQMSAMLSRFPPSVFEAVVHQHMPMFHMEHCVFCHTLSKGTSYRDCGRPCDVHKVELRDREGAAHPLVADVGCRNTVYNAAAQSAAEFIPRMKELGLKHFRVEMLRESPEQVGPLLDRYARVLRGLENGWATWRQLRVLNQLGLTRGTLND
jgi:putative protease